LISVAMLIALTASAGAQLNSQQQRMKDCNTQASGMSGDARKAFVSTCLSGGSVETKKGNASTASHAAIPVSPRIRSVTSEAAGSKGRPPCRR
jgi:hypothetical protein